MPSKPQTHLTRWIRLGLYAAGIILTAFAATYTAGVWATDRRRDVADLKDWQVHHIAYTEQSVSAKGDRDKILALLQKDIQYIREAIGRIEAHLLDVAAFGEEGSMP